MNKDKLLHYLNEQIAGCERGIAHLVEAGQYQDAAREDTKCRTLMQVLGWVNDPDQADS